MEITNQQQFHPSNFFDLSSWEHATLYDGEKPVWEVLSYLSQYIHAFLQKSQNRGKYKGNMDVVIGEGSVISDTAVIQGPAIIGKNCHILPGAFIRENVILSDNVTIGHGSEIKQSIFLPQATAAHFTYVGDSVVGANVNIAAGVVIANMRLDKQNIRIKSGTEEQETNLPKMGAIIGDNTQVGAHAVLNPGTILGKQTLVYPLTSVVGVYPEHAVIKSK